jgi:hypothetical protein
MAACELRDSFTDDLNPKDGHVRPLRPCEGYQIRRPTLFSSAVLKGV